MGHESFIEGRARLGDLKAMRTSIQSRVEESVVPITELQDTKDTLESLEFFISTADSLGANDYVTIYEESELESKLTQEINESLHPVSLSSEWFFEYYTIDAYSAVRNHMQKYTAFYLYGKTWRFYYG